MQFDAIGSKKGLLTFYIHIKPRFCLGKVCISAHPENKMQLIANEFAANAINFRKLGQPRI